MTATLAARVRCPACKDENGIPTGMHRYMPDLGGRFNFSDSSSCGLCHGSGTLDPDEWHTCTDPARMVAMLGGWNADGHGQEIFVQACLDAAIKLEPQMADWLRMVTHVPIRERVAMWSEPHHISRLSKLPYKTRCNLLRCLFPNPLTERSIDPRWLSSTVCDLVGEVVGDSATLKKELDKIGRPDGARGEYMRQCIHDKFGPKPFKLPILADALMDAGCDDEEILNHCRGPGPHVSGCWVIEAISAAAAHPPDREGQPR